MDFLHRAKAFIVPYASTLFIAADGQTHAIPMRRDAEKKKVLPAHRFSKDKESGYLTALKREEKPMCVEPSISSEKLPGRKRAYRKTRWKHAKDQRIELLNVTHRLNQVKETPPMREAT